MEASIIKQRQALQQAFGIPSDNLSFGDLVVYAALGNDGSITWQIMRNVNSDNIAANMLLSQNDAFIMTELAINVAQVASDTPTDAEIATAFLSTFYNPKVFTAGNDGNLQAIYNSKLSLDVDSKVVIPEFHSSRFEVIPEAQQGNTTTAFVDDGSADNISTIGRSEKESSNYGFVKMAPMIFRGGQNVEFKLNLPGSFNFDSASITNYAVLRLRGFLAVGGA